MVHAQEMLFRRANEKRGTRLRGFKGLMMAVTTLKSLIFVGLVASVVSGCEPGTGATDVSTEPLADAAAAADPAAAGTEPATATAVVAPATSVKLVDHDVEAPNDFQTTDKALWDGRPSLGGVWVAATGVKDPMRVIMRNPTNGKFVIGALFRREADNPGPKLQISSDAADALGLVAGEPATINVTALRSETVGSAPAADVAAPAIAAAVIKPVTKPAVQPAVPVVTAAAATPVVATPVVAATGGTSIQIGIFSVEDNAKRAVATLAKSGVTASVRKETSHGKPLWSVIASGDAALLAKIKTAGFTDAYFLKR
jgi:hypothetical protein